MSLSTRPILVVDDEPDVLLGIKGTLRAAGLHNVKLEKSAELVMASIEEHQPDLLLLDIRMPRVSGLELLEQIRDGEPDLPVIMITGVDDVRSAVECMKRGAFDYLVKSEETTRLVNTVRKALDMRALQRENTTLREHLLRGELTSPEAFSEIVTVSSRMISLFLYLETIAPTSRPVLITGETGVGKELVARAVHRLSGRAGELVAVNVSGFDDHLFADTLFGHEKGAFTGAERPLAGLITRAAGGTLFLDEIGELSAPSQVKLLRLLDEGQYFPVGADVPRRSEARVLTATNRDLEDAVASGSFREDLYYRLRTHAVIVPPLRERREDIKPLVELFLEEAARELGKPVPTVPPSLYTLLGVHPFTGNVRELRSLIFEAVTRHRGGVLSTAVFREALGKPALPTAEDGPEQTVRFGDMLPTLRQVGDLLVDEALQRAGGNQTVAARMLGVTQQALSKRLRARSEDGHN